MTLDWRAICCGSRWSDTVASQDVDVLLEFCNKLIPDAVHLSSEPTHVVVTQDLTDYIENEYDHYKGYIGFECARNSVFDAGLVISVKNVKVEQGSKATDWTPAPEDMQPAIFDAAGNCKLSADNLRTLATALQNYLQ